MNNFAGQNIYIPNELREHFARLCQTRIEGISNRVEDSPFPRMVDLWFAGFCYAVKNQMPQETINQKNSYNAIEGNVFGNDTFRSDMMSLFCVSKTGQLEILSSPGEMLRLCNSYAIPGVRAIISELQAARGDEALDYICDLFDKVDAA